MWNIFRKNLKHHISIHKHVAPDIAKKALVIFYKFQNKSRICLHKHVAQL